MSNQLISALGLAREGFQVFPLQPNGKQPLFPQGWKELATTDPDTIKGWYKQNPHANVAIRTDGFVAIDLDIRRGGDESWRDLLELIGEPLPDTRIHETWSGGRHIIFRQPEGMQIGNSTDKLGTGVDVKATGGYLAAPGSKIGDKVYRILNPHTPIAELPRWLADLCKQVRSRSPAAGKRLVEEDEVAIANAAAWLIAHGPDAVEGGRDDAGYKVAAKLYNFGVSRDTCREMLGDWNYGHCFPPMDPEDIERLARSAEVNRSQPIGIEHPAAPAFEPVDIAERSARPTQPAAPAVERPKLYYLTAKESAARALTHAAEPLIDGLLDCGTMSVVYGESNSGKSFAALDFSYHIAAGRAWNGREVRQGAVVYVAAEGGGNIHKRVAALGKRYGDIKIPLYIVPCPVNLLRSDADLQPLIELAKQAASEAGVDLVMIVIDTLSRAISGGDENSSVDMGAFVRNCDRLRLDTRAHLCVIHHSGKDRARGARGHSLLRAATDTEIEVVDNVIKSTKQRDLDGAFELRFAIKPVQIGLDDRGHVVTSCTVEFRSPAGEGEPLELTPADTAVLEMLEAMVHDEAATWVNPDGTKGRPIAEHPVTWEHMAKVLAYQKGYEDTESLPMGKGFSRQTCQRALTKLTELAHLRKGERGQWFIKVCPNAH